VFFVLTYVLGYLTVCYLPELIGEEIYDEFDPETEHHLTSYIPEPSTGEMSTSHPGAPQSALSEKSHNDALPERPSSKDVDKPISKSATSTPLLRPIAVPAIPALPGLKNLSLFTNTTRSRSAPPTPQGGKKSDLSTAVTGVSEGHSSPVAEAQGVSVLGEDTPDGAITPTEAPTIMVEEASPVKDGPRRAEPTTVTFADAPTIAGAPLHAPTPVHAQPASAIPPGVQASLSAPTSRTGSPAPSLEALILGSKRRQQQQQQAGPAGSGLAATHPVHPKGMSFKSTPLRGGAAERIMQGLRVGERNHEEDEKMIGDDSKE
jgi:metal transporter CNNM